MMNEEDILLGNNSNNILSRTMRIANFLTFLSFQPYVSPDLTDVEVKEVNDMRRLKKGFEDTFYHYVTLHQPNLDYSIEFVNYVNLCHGWFNLKETYQLYLTDYCSVDVSETHKERFQALVVILSENNINIFEVAGVSNRKAIVTSIKAYDKFYGPIKKKSFKKSWKWKIVNLSLSLVALLVIVYVAVQN